MRTTIKGALLLAIGAAIGAPSAAIAQEAEVTANAGWVSQYYYRGLLQKESSASAGLDVATGNFSAGTWAADVGDGAEVDLYAGVGFDLTDMVSASVGGTGYFYTGQFDDTYLEVNLGLAFGLISIEWSLGSYRTDPDATPYTFIGVTAEQDGLFATIGTSGYNSDGLGDAIGDAFDKDLGFQYVEAGYGFSAMDLDFSISGIFNDAALSGEFNTNAVPIEAEPELTFVFGVSKTFALN